MAESSGRQLKDQWQTRRPMHTLVQHSRVPIPRQHNDIVHIELSAGILVARTARSRHVGTHG